MGDPFHLPGGLLDLFHPADLPLFPDRNRHHPDYLCPTGPAFYRAEESKEAQV